jgi:L-lactate dehydrogenase complex protein LldG
MSSRERILSAITANKPGLLAAPALSLSVLPDRTDMVARYVRALELIAGKAVVVSSFDAVMEDVRATRAAGHYVVNTIAALGPLSDEVTTDTHADTLEPIYKAFLSAEFGVVENGAVWMTESQMQNRLVPFICQHLVICIRATDLVPNMHEAYDRIREMEGYGLFLAGPSKTADIEQSLVIGAHGARSLVVYVVE